MKISDNALNMLTAIRYRGVGRKWINDNLQGCSSVAQIVDRLAAKVGYVSESAFLAQREDVRRRIEALGDAVDGVTGMGDEDFPCIPDRVKPVDRPVALFYRGNLELIRRVGSNVAVIGLLGPDDTIRSDESRVVRELIRRGKCIVSGLALGCDTVGHETAVANGGRTVAFLAGPLNEVNPPSNRPLAKEIVAQGGLLVSEYYEKARSRNEFLSRYPERDRLQAMFAGMVVLSASYAPNRLGLDCGSRFAMGKALEYGVPRAVIYNHAHAVGNAMYDLNRKSIGEGARIIDPANVESMQLPDVSGLDVRQGSLFD